MTREADRRRPLRILRWNTLTAPRAIIHQDLGASLGEFTTHGEKGDPLLKSLDFRGLKKGFE